MRRHRYTRVVARCTLLEIELRAAIDSGYIGRRQATDNELKHLARSLRREIRAAA